MEQLKQQYSLQDAKNNVANKYGYSNWNAFVSDEAAEIYAQSKVSEALKLAESLAEKEKRELWDRACEAQKQICANSAYAIVFMGTGVVHEESILQATKPEYKP